MLLLAAKRGLDTPLVQVMGLLTEEEVLALLCIMLHHFPDCSLRFYTIGEIINSIIAAGFILREFNEHPNWTNNKLPEEFTIIAIK